MPTGDEARGRGLMGKVRTVEKWSTQAGLVVIFLIFISLILQSNYVTADIQGCPDDDTLIKRSVTLNTSKPCYVPDKGDDGVLIIQSSDIVLDCGGGVLKGNFSGYPHVYKFGIINGGYENVTIKNCVIKNYGDGILLFNADNNKIVHNTLINNSNGIVIDNGTLNKLYSNFFHSNNKGIAFLPFSTENIVRRNKIYSSGGAGIEVEGSYRNVISNNFIGPTEDSRKRGIWLRVEPQRNKIYNNTFSGNTTIVQGNYRKKSYPVAFSLVNPSPQTLDIIQDGHVRFEKVFMRGDVIYLPRGNYTFVFNADGYRPKEKKIELDDGVKISSNLKEGKIDILKQKGKRPKDADEEINLSPISVFSCFQFSYHFYNIGLFEVISYLTRLFL